ncbi:MAG: hypothetical protein ACRCS6_10105, partial [Turicibacter sp.]
MKKSLLIGMTVLSVGGMMGCSGTNQTDQKQDVENNPVIIPEEEVGKIPEDDSSASVTSYFGKVEMVLGNEVSLKLAEPTKLEDDGTDSEINLEDYSITYSTDEAGNQVAMIGGSSGELGNEMNNNGVGEVISFSAEEVESFKDSEGMFDELEYSGESKSIIIPAGVEILK